MALFNVLFDIAAKTASFESSMTRVEKRIDSVAGYAKKAGAIFGVAFAANQFRGFITGAIESGDAMAKAATKAGTAVEPFSELAYAAKQADVHLESLSKAVQFMQKAVANGSTALGEIGISLTDLRGLSADKQFEELADAIAGIQDPAMRTKYVLEIFGKAGADLLPLFEKGAAGIREGRKAAKELGLTLSEDVANQFQEADDAIKRLTESVNGFWRTVAVGAVRSAEFFGVMDPTELKATAKEFDALVERRRAVLEQMREMEGKGFPASVLASQMAQLQKNLAMVESQMNAINDRRQKLANGSGDQLFPITISAKRLDAPSVKDFINPQLMVELERNFEWIDEQIEFTKDRFRSLNDAVNDFMKVADKGIDEGVSGTLDQIERDLDGVNNAFMKSIGSVDQMSEFAKSAAQNMQSYFADFLFDPFENGVKGMLKGFVDVIRRMAAEAAAAKVFETLFGKKDSSGGGGIAGVLGSFLGGLFGGFKASGGPVSAGKGYIVGERGPEWFMPGSSGSIVPNGAMASGPNIVINQYNDNRGSTSDFLTAFPTIQKKNNDALEYKIIEGLKRGRYGRI